MGIDILLFNVRTTRCRNFSDIIIENGLSILENHLQQHGLEVVVEDPGTLDFYESLSPRFLTVPIHYLTGKILDSIANDKKPSKILGGSSIALQRMLDKVQDRRMRGYLDSLVDRVIEERIPVVGKKVWYGSSNQWSKEFTKMLNQRAPEVIVVDGGPHPSVYQEDYLRDTDADFIVISEGEEALTRIVSIVKHYQRELSKEEIIEKIKQDDIPNIGYRDNGRNVIIPVNRTSLDVKTAQRHDSMDDRLRVAVINDALGCAYNSCNFCAYKNIEDRHMTKSPHLVVEEMKYFLRKGVGLFRYTSGSSVLSDSVAIAEEITRNRLIVNYSFFNRVEPNAARDFEKIVDQYSILISSGLKAVFLGAESGNDDVLREVMNKGITRQDIVYTVKAIREASKKMGQHIDICLSFIFPHPVLEGIVPEKSASSILKLVQETMPESVLPTPPAPLSYTQWLEDEKFGFDYYDPEKPETADLSREEKRRLIAIDMMNMDYLLYLPLSMWEVPNITMNGIGSREAFEMNMSLRNALAVLDVEVDLGDEHFLLLRAAGYEGKEGISEYKRRTMQAIISCNYGSVRDIFDRVNKRSEELAHQNAIRLEDS